MIDAGRYRWPSFDDQLRALLSLLGARWPGTGRFLRAYDRKDSANPRGRLGAPFGDACPTALALSRRIGFCGCGHRAGGVHPPAINPRRRRCISPVRAAGPEPVLLRLRRRELLAAHRQAVADGAIPELVHELLDGHSGEEIACLLCDRQCSDPPFLEVVDPGHDPFYVVGCVLCADCAAMPPLVRVARCLRMLRRMLIRR